VALAAAVITAPQIANNNSLAIGQLSAAATATSRREQKKAASMELLLFTTAASQCAPTGHQYHYM